MKRLWSRASSAWCHAMHPAPMWPVKGYYTCPKCLRSYRVPWEQECSTARTENQAGAVTRTAAAAVATAIASH
ncbi:MAG TPA: hypothetical protein VN428_01115 [Bryobacteraceae bacterium]|nr:hypothetical protein [Bryobacteraceae bacterium]